jgi:nitrite reductase (NADH) small subunit
MEWVRVAGSAEVTPGAGKAVIAGGRELALFVVDGQYYCIDNCCPHMEGPLADGDVEGEIVYCPWHYWPINIRTGELTFDPGVCAATYPCRVEGDSVLVNLNPGPAT